MNRQALLVAVTVGVVGWTASPANAQTSAPADRWSVEVATGFDNSISGNINSGAAGNIDNQPVVITKNSYEDVYGSGLHFTFGGGYMLNENTQVRGMFTLQSLDADLTPMGDIGTSRLYAKYDDYQSFGLDVGLRRYTNVQAKLRPYAEGSLGIAFIDETDVQLTAPSADIQFDATDFYDKTTAFSFAANAGLLWQATNKFGVFGQLGMRLMTGMSQVDNLIGTGLDDINDNSARWTIPFVFGLSTRF
jgi:hypothetical protein